MLQKEIRRLRVAKGVSQEQLAEKLHITRHALSQYETGKRSVTLEMFEDILKALDVSIKYHVHDLDMRVKVISSHFFETWRNLEARFPDWEVAHTGGGFYVLRREFLTKQGIPVLVNVTDTGSFLLKKLRRDENEEYGIKVYKEYTSKEEYDNHSDLYEEYEVFSFEVIHEITHDGYECKPIGKLLFDEIILDELEYHADILCSKG